MRRTLATFALAAAFTAAALTQTSPARAAVRLEAVPDYELELAAAELAGAAAEEAISLAAPASDLPAKLLVVPFYEIDRSRPDGKTTLIAVRNNSIAGSIRISLSFVGGRALSPAAYTTYLWLGPRQVRTLNLRDLPVPSRGAVSVAMTNTTVEAPGLLSGDYFLVDPRQGSAVGERMIVADEGLGCPAWQVRYLQGGVFTGGTQVHYLVERPLGAVNPTMLVRVVDEAGTVRGTVRVFATEVVGSILVSQILAALPGASPFGALEIEMAPAAGRNAISATMSASGRYSVGLHGACLR